MFIGLNPSTADAQNDDPTIRRCVGYAKEWGFDALSMTNLYAYRSPFPEGLYGPEDPVGFHNDFVLRTQAKRADLIIAAWGSMAKMFGNRHEQVASMIPNLHCLKLNKDGAPAHPLYLKKDLTPFLFAAPVRG